MGTLRGLKAAASQYSTDGVAHVANLGLSGTYTSAAFWADATYADADTWTSATGCNLFWIEAWDDASIDADGGPAADQGFIVAWSTTASADLSEPIAAMMTGAASVAKTEKEATLTEQTNCRAWRPGVPFIPVYSATPIKTIRIVGMADSVCTLHTVTVA